jgi:hypothetical protein
LVTVVATREPLSLSAVPDGRVLRLNSISAKQLAVWLDPLPPDVPAVITYRTPAEHLATAAAIGHMLDRLEAIARELFPSWLPDAEVLSSSSDHDRRVVRLLAHRHASGSDHFGPFLADMAESAMLGRASSIRFDPHVRARGLARIIGASYGNRAVVLLPDIADDVVDDDQLQLAAAFEWLANHGGIGVWLTGDALPVVDRFASVSVRVPDYIAELSATSEVAAPAIDSPDFPALAGRPHPGSAVEQLLERCLSVCEWAAARKWNETWNAHPLLPPIRVDLMWAEERCVIELDGPDHRERYKYADDRRRDNALVVAGFAVLRFTNDEVVDDPQRVLATVETLLSTRRQKGRQP